MHRNCLVCVVAFAVLTSVVLAARQEPPPAPQQPTFRARIDAVSVDVIVVDRQGKPVTDLTADDFEIREANKVQKIDAFKFIQVPESPPGDPAAERQIVSFDAQRRETASEDNRLLVILLDDYHVRRENSLKVREVLARFVSRLTPRDLVAVAYPLSPPGGLTFSRYHEGTAAAIMKFEGRKYDYTPRNAFEERYQIQPPELLERMRNEMTIRGLESLCVYLGGLREGRKTVLFVSEGLSGTLPPGVRVTGNLVNPSRFPSSSSESFSNSLDLLSQFRMLFVAAARNNTSIYTYDPRGLTSSEFDVSDRVAAEADRQILNESLDSLRTIADQTDGRAIVSRNDPMPEFQRMMRDGSAYYLLGYTSSVAPRDGKFHEIDVRVKRRDVEVRARKGYWAYTAEDAERAAAPPKPAAPRDVVEALDALAEVAEPAARRSFSVWLGAARGAGEKAVVTFAWEPNGSTLLATDAETIERVTITATSVHGEELFKGPVPRDPNAARPGGRMTFEAPAGSIRVRVIAENARGTRVDSEDATLEVPDFSTPGPTISTPVVFRGRTARDIQIVKSAAAPVPTAVRVFSRTERLLVRFDAYGPAGTTPTITMRLLNRLGDSMAALPAPAAAGGATFQSEFALGPLPPGDYLIEMVATSGSDSTRKLLAIRVTG